MDPSWKNPGFMLKEKLKFEIRERPVPELRDAAHDVLVRVAWTGICGSDVHYWRDGRIGQFALERPMVLGHESAGVVEAVGAAVTALRPGDRVAMEPGVPCRRCTACKAGRYNLCPHVVFAASAPHDGTLQRFYSIAADFCYKLPDSMSLEEGALVEPTAVAVHIVKLVPVTPGNSVVIFGAGPVGILCAAVSRAFGAENIAIVDINEMKLKFAQDFVPGCQTFVPSTDVGPRESAEALKKKCPAIPIDGADVAIDASGAASAIQTAIFTLRSGGTFVQGGMGRDEINFPILETCFKELTVKGSFRYGPGDYTLAISMISRGMIDVNKMISKKYKFEDAEEAFKAAHEGKVIKAIIQGP